MSKFDNAMRRQALSLPALLADQYHDLEPKARSILSFQEIFSIQRIILTGCGDSRAASMAVKLAFEKLTGIPTEVVTALDLSRYHDSKQLGFAPQNPLVIAVSNSGGAARVGEAIQRAVGAGAFALGITGRRDSLLGRGASRVLDLEIPSFESAPGVRSYLVSVLSLLLLAIRLGEVRGRYTMDRANAYRRDLLRQGEALDSLLPAMDRQAEALAERWKDFDAFDFAGAGKDLAAAWYGHAKVFEAVGKRAMCVNAEEWLHLNFFMRDVDTTGTSVVCTGRNRGICRVREMVHHAAADMRRPTAVVTDEPELFQGEGVEIFEIPKTEYDFSSALTNFVPLALLAGFVSAMIGETYSRGCKDRWAFADHGAGITQSAIILD